MMTSTAPRFYRWMVGLACAVGLCSVDLAWANVVITGTRVIYPAEDREVTIKLDNNGDLPALVQTWVDKGDPTSRPDTADVPFILMPPVFRIEPQKGQTLRLSYTHDPLPQDKESVFWLNVLDIPPKAANADGENLLQMAFRTRIKIFFRPTGLDAEGAASAARGLVWKLEADPAGGYAMQASNPSPYNVTVSTLRVKLGQHEFNIKEGAMIAPGGTHTFSFDEKLPLIPSNAEIDYSTLDDFGASISSKAVLRTQASPH
jgi:chaperone protein EcpD